MGRKCPGRKCQAAKVARKCPILAGPKNVRVANVRAANVRDANKDFRVFGVGSNVGRLDHLFGQKLGTAPIDDQMHPIAWPNDGHRRRNERFNGGRQENVRLYAQMHEQQSGQVREVAQATTLKGRLAMILGDGEGADVHFLVGEGAEKELIAAHKVLLIPASEVFRAMFRFDQQNSNFGSVDNPVEVPDVEAAAFKVMLRFIYTDGLSGLNGDNAMAVLYAARKYGIDALADPCLQFPISTLRNVFLAYALATLLQLENFCPIQSDSLIRSDDFLQIDQKTLCEILERDQLQICGEISIWKAALRWADCQCLQNGHECSAENRRAALGPALFQIRFPLFQPTKFSEIIVPSGILTMEEFVGVYQFYCHPNFQGLFPLQFPCHGRVSDRHHATIVLHIEKFSEFAREIVGSERSSDAAFVGGMPWKIRATIKMAKQSTGKCLDLYLWCCATSVEEGEGDENWSRKCSAIFRIIGQGNGTEDFTRKFDDQIFNSEICNLGWSEFVTLSKLMDSSKGLYDQKADKVALAIDVTVK
ncbi:hypothetical protein niasHS_016813 [Heterodera schachtii]|uniref:BTB domain-containing protein n=1 Tax=Heterodera schachtii TaxID=97005 RepID=A0ABD2HRQ5_HETSC